MNKPTIAMLPINNEQKSPGPSPTFIQTDNPVLNTVDYSDKSFIVFGNATKTYKQQLAELGGKFNMYLKERPGFPGGAGWIFFTKNKGLVYKFLNQVNSGEIKHHEAVMHQDINGDNGMNLPTVIAPIKQSNYQYVKWKVFKPSEGMKVTIKAGGVSVEGKVLQVETHNNIVDTAYISLGANTSKLVITNGFWTVHGYMVEHRVHFSSNNPETNEDHNEGNDDMVNI